MIKDYHQYDQELGPDGVYAWPGCRDVAKKFIEAALYAKSSADSLNDYFFYEYLDCLDADLFDQYPYEEALELVEAAAKSRQELFKEARNWLTLLPRQRTRYCQQRLKKLVTSGITSFGPFFALMSLYSVCSGRKDGERFTGTRC
jgi:hypothetical protein